MIRISAVHVFAVLGLAATVGLGLALPACSGGDEATADGITSEHWYALSSLVIGADGNTTYVATTSSLDVPELDYTKAREFPGTADIWVHEGFLFVGSAEDASVTKFEVMPDGGLTELG